MQRASFDPGLTQQFTAPFRRVINKDGSFNVHRRGETWRDFHPYLQLINMGWAGFLAVLFTGYMIINTIFAGIYYAVGTDQLQGTDAPTAAGRFINTFFFSAHTLSTVGYGSIWPKGIGANIVALFRGDGRCARFRGRHRAALRTRLAAFARLGFSENMLIAPYQSGTSLQFRIVNRRRNSVMELECRVMIMTVEMENGRAKRNYNLLNLERDKVTFLPLTWTIVHPIDADSPLWRKTAEDLKQMQAEFLILTKAFDDTFSQTVLARYSYKHDEILWDRKFAPAFFCG